MINQALKELVRLVDGGMEYPTAHERVCVAYKFTEEQGEKLTAKYDQMCDADSHARTPR